MYLAPDLSQRNLTPTAPHQAWTGGITYITTDEGWLYEKLDEPQGQLLGQRAHRKPVGRLKVGHLYGQKFATRREAMDEVIDGLMFYNHRRRHSTLGYLRWFRTVEE